MGGLMSYLFPPPPPDPRVPIQNASRRFKNMCSMHFKGLIGFFIPLFVLPWQGEYGRHDKTVQCMWMWMFWFFLLQPVNIPVTGLIPIFLLPMAGVMSTASTCGCYMTENMILFLLAGMLILLLNNSGFDRRVALATMCAGDPSQFNAPILVLKCSMAAYFLSMFSNRLIVTSAITSSITTSFTGAEASAAKRKKENPKLVEPSSDAARYVINNAIHTSSAIGSIAIMHSAYATLAFRNIWCASAGSNMEYPDIFNYLEYSVFAFPVSIVMIFFNILYHILLCFCVKTPISESSKAEIRKGLLKIKSTLPSKTTAHEYLTIFFTILALTLFLCRWSILLEMGWATFRHHPLAPQIPILKDATVAALIVIVCNILPKGIGFIKLFAATKKSQLTIKPESGILWWRFVDKNLNYGYIFLFGSGVALNTAIRISGLGVRVATMYSKAIPDMPWIMHLFMVCLVSVILAQAMTGVAACVIFMPFILNVYTINTHIAALAVGLGSSLGFMFPFLYTPAYFCHYVGKVPVSKMAKYSAGSVIICFFVLWISLFAWAPYIWSNQISPVITNVITIPVPITTTTTTTEATVAEGNE